MKTQRALIGTSRRGFRGAPECVNNGRAGILETTKPNNIQTRLPGEEMSVMSKSLSDVTRRDFLKTAGHGVAAVSTAAALVNSEIARAQLRVPEPPGKKLGWAVVGLGSLAINQILPAFAKCAEIQSNSAGQRKSGEGTQTGRAIRS
ncbi:MAG: ubiquinol-cytochrome c reductase iron-sulfur subunit N-terminal domain-containing protein [Pyrinomonadaceae bacterium]